MNYLQIEFEIKNQRFNARISHTHTHPRLMILKVKDDRTAAQRLTGNLIEANQEAGKNGRIKKLPEQTLAEKSKTTCDQLSADLSSNEMVTNHQL